MWLLVGLLSAQLVTSLRIGAWSSCACGGGGGAPVATASFTCAAQTCSASIVDPVASTRVVGGALDLRACQRRFRAGPRRERPISANFARQDRTSVIQTAPVTHLTASARADGRSRGPAMSDELSESSESASDATENAEQPENGGDAARPSRRAVPCFAGGLASGLELIQASRETQ